MILDQPFPPDARVEREAVALVQAGYEVHILCPLTPQHPEPEAYYRGIYVHRVNPDEVTTGGFFNLRYQGWFRNLVQRVFAIDPRWMTLIQRFIQQYQPHGLHAHDLKVLPATLHAARRCRIPVIADLHENYPALMALLKGKYDDGSPNPARAQQQHRLWDAIESRALEQCTEIITVIEAARQRLIEKGVDPQRITVVPNTVDDEKFLAVSPDPGRLRALRPYFVLTYVGHVNGPHRGLQTVLHAMARLTDVMPDLRFVAAGESRDAYLNDLQSEAEALRLTDRILWTGQLDETEFVDYITASDICICPHLANDHTNATFPNKLYLYHLFGKPVIASDCKPIQAYIAETEGGVVFSSGDADALAQQILTLYQNAPMRKQLGEAGREAVLERYRWAHCRATLLGVYERIVGLPVFPSPSIEREAAVRTETPLDTLLVKSAGQANSYDLFK
jgi:glycosyltransferase involved in cell wall biosynthesis